MEKLMELLCSLYLYTCEQRKLSCCIMIVVLRGCSFGILWAINCEVSVSFDVTHDLRKFVYDIMDSVRMKMNGLMWNMGYDRDPSHWKLRSVTRWRKDILYYVSM